MQELNQIQRAIALYLQENPLASLDDIAKAHGFKSPNAARWHVQRLEALGVIVEKPARTGWKVKLAR